MRCLAPAPGVPVGIRYVAPAPARASVARGDAFEAADDLELGRSRGRCSRHSCLAALPVAYLSARGTSGVSSLPERATYVGYAVPGVVLGLALVFFGSSYARLLYQTLYLLVFAYVIRFLPQAIGSSGRRSSGRPGLHRGGAVAWLSPAFGVSEGRLAPRCPGYRRRGRAGVPDDHEGIAGNADVTPDGLRNLRHVHLARPGCRLLRTGGGSGPRARWPFRTLHAGHSSTGGHKLMSRQTRTQQTSDFDDVDAAVANPNRTVLELDVSPKTTVTKSPSRTSRSA